jgi:hypothetical protein
MLTPDVTIVSTRDEAIAVAVAESEDGDEVAIHEATCSPGADPCTCTPTVIVVRRGKA